MFGNEFTSILARKSRKYFAKKFAALPLGPNVKHFPACIRNNYMLFIYVSSSIKPYPNNESRLKAQSHIRDSWSPH